MKSKLSSWPSFTKEEADAVKNILLSNKVNYWTGNECLEFEKEFSLWCGSKYSIALANGTLALDAAFKALDIKHGDEVIVTPRSYIASISSIINAGASPVFADVDLDSQNITAQSIDAVLTDRTKAIVCVHLAGWPCDMDEIMKLANNHGLYVIEDCSQAHGAIYKDRPVGSIGHIGCWSFCQDKIISTGGEGGMVTTNSVTFWRKMWAYKDHGKSYKAVYETKHPEGFKWLHESFGSNFRMTEMQATIGRIQLKKMHDWHEKRLNNAKYIWNVAKNCKGIRVPKIPDFIEHAAYKCYLFVEGGIKLRNKIMSKINEKGIPCYSGACPEVYLEKAFDKTNFRPKKRLMNAKTLGETSLMFLVHPTLSKHEIKQTCEALMEVTLNY